jgi:hypothetical protein
VSCKAGGAKSQADSADLDFAASMAPVEPWPGLRGPVGTFVDVRMVMEPPEQLGFFDVVFEPPGLFVVVAIDAEEIGIGFFEEFLGITLVPAVFSARGIKSAA